MKLLRHYRIFSRPLVFLVAFLFTSFTTDKFNVVAPEKDQTIMIALLLDTSNSMDGLIDQAKSQLWKIVNEVAVAKSQDGKRPNIKIALYEYGNAGLSSNEGFIRQVSALSEDLDVISEKLFSLRTNGGNEFCGQVIKTSLDQLTWSASKDDLKMIFIAGNEDFKQGSVSYEQACDAAKKKGVVVNTIYCGYFNDGINLGWNRGAELTSGAFMSIDQNNKTAYVPTPYDDQMAALNDKLNATYVYYGESGEERKEQQIVQDNNAASYGSANIAERSFCKSSHAYKNSSWDLVDAAKENEKVITVTKSEDLPEEMRTMSIEQRKAYIKQKSEERTKIQSEIQSLNKKRQEYIYKTPQGGKDKTLDASMMKAIKEQGHAKNLKWDQVEEVEEVEEGEKGNKSGVANILFQSTDGGQTWQDISEGLPAIEQPISFFAGESDLYLKVKNVMYRSKNNLKTPVWEKENVPDPQNASIAFNPMNVVESEGVLIATGQKGIMRSTDNGEHWQWVISEGGVGIAVERIKGGFAAITYSTASNTRRVRTSYDGGKTWQAIDAGLPADLSIASIIQVGENFFCGHPKGIYRSTDKGKTWKLLLPSIEGKVFNLSVSGNVIYAIPRSGGC